MPGNCEVEDEREQDENDGFNVVGEMPPSLWVDYGFDAFGEYIHLVPDPEAHELRCYRSVSEATEGNERIKTTIERVNFSFHYDGKAIVDGERNRKVTSFYLTNQQAESFMTFIDLVTRGRESSIGLSWWEESGMEMMENKRTGVETMNLRFTKSNGVERRMQISSAWQCPVHKMANIEGEGY